MEFEEDPEPQVPALSAGISRKKSRRRQKKKSKRRANRPPSASYGGRKLKYREMVINAIRSGGESRGTNFNKICRYVDKKYRMKNDFIVKHTLKWLCDKKILSRQSGKYKLMTPLLPSAGRRRRQKGRGGKSRKRRGKKGRGKKGKKGKKGKGRKGRRRRGKGKGKKGRKGRKRKGKK